MRLSRPACARPRCPNTSVKGSSLCAEHRTEDTRQWDKRHRDPERRKIYDSARWRKLRKIVLARDPVCRLCGEAPSTDADHVKAISQGGEIWRLTNIQGLCATCHGRKTQEEVAKRTAR